MENWLRRLAMIAVVAACGAPALAIGPSDARAGDFPNDVKRTFTTDIPHFFQDDIPCTFGGQPTSGTRSSCKGSGRAGTSAHKAPAHKKKRSATQHAAGAPSDQASAGASAGATSGMPAGSSAAPR